MKLSSRKQLLKESEMKLTEIRKSLNESSIDDVVVKLDPMVNKVMGDFDTKQSELERELVKEYVNKLNTTFSKELQKIVGKKFKDIASGSPVKSASFIIEKNLKAKDDFDLRFNVLLVTKHENGKTMKTTF